MKMNIYLKAAMPLCAALMLVSCSEKGGGDTPEPSGPSTRAAAEIQFISRMNDASLSSSDIATVSGYIRNLSDKASLTIVDRADASSVTEMMKISVATYRWWTFAANKSASGAAQGSAIFYNNPLRLISSVPSGDGARVTGMTPTVSGVFQKLDAEGNVTSSNDVTSDVDFSTVRFDSEAQISAFGGASGVLSGMIAKNKSLLVIGTVKSSLYSSLETSVSGTDSSYAVHKIASAGDYTLFMIGATRYWDYHGCHENALSSGLVSYEISVGWK